MHGPRRESEDQLAQPPRTADLSELPAENFGTVAAGICTFSPGRRGLTPVRAARCWVENFPKPVKLTASPRFNESVIESRNASTALAASRLFSPLFDATCSTNSCFVTSYSSRRL